MDIDDLDASFQISIYDAGPKLVSLGTASSNAYKSFDIRVCALLFSKTNLWASPNMHISSLYRVITCYPTCYKNSLTLGTMVESGSFWMKPVWSRTPWTVCLG